MSTSRDMAPNIHKVDSSCREQRLENLIFNDTKLDLECLPSRRHIPIRVG